MKRFIAIVLIFSFQILFNNCLLEQNHAENDHFVSEDAVHHESQEQSETDHHENNDLCCEGFNLIYPGRTQVIIDKNALYQDPRNDIFHLAFIDSAAFFQRNPIKFDYHGPPEITHSVKFFLFVFFNHAPPNVLSL